MRQTTEHRPGSELIEAIKEWSRFHDLNESVIAQKGTPSDSEMDFEVEAWSNIEKMASDLVTRESVEDTVATKVAEAKAELKARFIALCKDYAEDAQPHTSYRLALEDLIEGLENGDENLVQPEPFEALYPINEQKEELAELLFQAEYQDDAKKLMYPKAHYERIATEVINYFKTENPEADRYREKFIVADERAVKWQQEHETMRLHLKSNITLLSTAATAIAPFARIQAFLPAGYPDEKIPEGLHTNSTGEYRQAYKIKNDLDKAIDATEALLKPKGSE